MADLKKLFTEAYASENLTSTILLQRFLTGLLLPIHCQLLLLGKPETLAQPVKDTANIEYALNFARALYLTNRNHQYTIPITQGTYKLQDVPPNSIILDAASVTADDFTICAPSNLSIPGRTVQFITGKLNVPCDTTSALVDLSTQSPTHICVAR